MALHGYNETAIGPEHTKIALAFMQSRRKRGTRMPDGSTRGATGLPDEMQAREAFTTSPAGRNVLNRIVQEFSPVRRRGGNLSA